MHLFAVDLCLVVELAVVPHGRRASRIQQHYPCDLYVTTSLQVLHYRVASNFDFIWSA